LAKQLSKLTRDDLKKEIKEKEALRSYEYSAFKKEKAIRKGWYEKACKRAGKFFPMKLTSKEFDKLKNDIRKSDLNVTPSEVSGFSMIVLIFGIVFSLLAIVISTSLITLMFLPVSFYGYIYISSYPGKLAKKKRMEETSEMVLSILYIVTYMRHTPNLEGAIRFAANNLQSQLGNDFKQVLWNIQTKKYRDIYESINSFLTDWTEESNGFAEAMSLIMSALSQSDTKKRDETLDIAVDTILNNTYDSMVVYANSLKTPVQAVSLLGITLPILGLVMLPMVSAFLSDLITTDMIFIFYDLILPVIVFFSINSALSKRPTGFAIPDVSSHPDVPPKNTFYLMNKGKKIFISVFILPIIILIISIILYISYILSVQGLPPSQEDVFGSLSIIIGITLALITYFYFSSFQKTKIRNKIASVESEFSNAAYILSNVLSEGKPLEIAIVRTGEKMKNSAIHDFFETIESNVKNLGLSIKDAIFDPVEGAMKLYPSMLVHSIMRILISTSEESTIAASISMSHVGRYTKSVHSINQKINDILSDTVSSVGFQANFIGPLITGVVVGLSTMIFLIINNLGVQMESISSSGTGLGGGTGMNLDFVLGFLNMSSSIQIWAFQPIVGFYLILVVLLMVYLINKIEFAGDWVYFMNKASKTLIMSIILYVVVVSITTLVFNGLAGVAVMVGK
jgi:Flp pilus assembly protein TadB